MSIGKRLAEERKRLGLNQDEFAEIGGVKRRAQSTYETDERAPDAIYLAKITEAGADYGYILTGTRSTAVRETAAAYASVDPRRERIVMMLDELDGEGLDHVQDAAEMAKQIKDMKNQIHDLEKRKAG